MKELIKKIAITVTIYIIYRLGFLITLAPSGKELSLLKQFLGKHGHSLFSLGFMPAITSFFLVEIIFLIIPSLKKIRNNGFEGRKLISYWGLGISFLIAALQSWGIVRFLWGMKTSTGMPLIANPSFLAFTSYSLFFIGGFALVLFLGFLISKFGIGNGFCILIGISIIENIFKNTYSYIQHIKINNYKPNYIGFIIFLSIVFFIINLMRKKDWDIQINNEKISSLKIPFFLQGVTVITFASTLIWLPSTLKDFGIELYQLPQYGTWGYAITVSVATIFASILGHLMFSRPKKIATNLGVAVSSIQMNISHLAKSTLILFMIVLFLSMPFPFWNQMFIPYIVSTFSLFILIAIAIDLYNEAIFIYNNNDYISLYRLDNIYLASTVKDKFKIEGINCHIQGYQYRRLYFFFQPFIKMRLLVPKNHYNKAQQVFNSIRTDFV